MTNKLKEKFEDFGSIPNPEVWTAIEEQLKRKRRKKRVLWIYFPGMVASLALIFLLALPGKDPVKNGLAERKKQAMKKEVNPGQQPETQDPGESLPQVADEIFQVKNAATRPLKKKNPLYNGGQHPADGQTSNKNIETLHDSMAVRVVEIKTGPDSLPAEQAKADSMDDSSLHDHISNRNPGKEPEKKSGQWSFVFQAGAWDAFNNRDVFMNEEKTNATTLSSSPLADSQAAPNESYTLSVYKPFTLRINMEFKSGGNWVLAGGLGFDCMRSRVNGEPGTFFSAGINTGLGKSFPLGGNFSITPFLLGAYDRVFYGKALLMDEYLNPLENNGSEFSSQSVSGNQLSLQLDVRLAYALGGRHSFYFSPAAKFYLLQSLSTEVPVLRRDFWSGIHLGWKYDF